ncbi:MAG: Asp-tRNA(Asn)/Glu-tRNA(Gln) amidotransferase subunit GatC [Gammaproteobacteria bacterium]|nr:Asp-tRNA(Asn)/Glu-tRNA(Gln) amidotransferase subunit GatC [Gammaproteobacteria bacterium]
MTLDINQVKKIAHLARLNIADKSDSDLTSTVNDLNKIFDWVDQMQSVDTTEIRPMAHPMATTQRLREDKITAEDQHTEYQKIAPAVESGLYLVPAVIE